MRSLARLRTRMLLCDDDRYALFQLEVSARKVQRFNAESERLIAICFEKHSPCA